MVGGTPAALRGLPAQLCAWVCVEVACGGCACVEVCVWVCVGGVCVGVCGVRVEVCGCGWRWCVCGCGVCGVGSAGDWGWVRGCWEACGTGLSPSYLLAFAQVVPSPWNVTFPRERLWGGGLPKLPRHLHAFLCASADLGSATLGPAWGRTGLGSKRSSSPHMSSVELSALSPSVPGSPP